MSHLSWINCSLLIGQSCHFWARTGDPQDGDGLKRKMAGNDVNLLIQHLKTRRPNLVISVMLCKFQERMTSIIPPRKSGERCIGGVVLKGVIVISSHGVFFLCYMHFCLHAVEIPNCNQLPWTKSANQHFENIFFNVHRTLKVTCNMTNVVSVDD